MNPKKCARCAGTFSHSNNSDLTVFCPFCGYVFANIDLNNRRKNHRVTIKKECFLLNGFGQLTAETTDVSKGGLGLTIAGKLPFLEGASLYAKVKDCDVFEYSQVVWVRDHESFSQVGLKYY